MVFRVEVLHGQSSCNGEMMVTAMGGQSSFSMCRLNLNFKILCEMMVTPMEGVNHLSACAG